MIGIGEILNWLCRKYEFYYEDYAYRTEAYMVHALSSVIFDEIHFQNIMSKLIENELVFTEEVNYYERIIVYNPTEKTLKVWRLKA